MRGGAGFRRSPRGPTGNEVQRFCTDVELSCSWVLQSLRRGGVGGGREAGLLHGE